MAQSAPRTRLEQRTQLAHLSVPEFVDRFRAAAIECGEDKADVSERQAKRWLAREAELYLLAGLVSGHLSAVGFELGHPEAAGEQARAAHTYGNVIDHPALCAWARIR